MGFVNYLVSNIPLFSICAVVLFLAIRNFKFRRNESIYFISFTVIVLFLSVVVYIENYSQAYSNVVLGTIFTALGYIFRPTLIYIFILLSNMGEKRKRRFYIFLLVPLAINLIVYILPLFMNVPALSRLVYYYVDNGDGTASFTRGTFLNFASHIVSVIYLGVLIYLSMVKFHGKHKSDGLVIVLVVIIIIVTVVAEMLAGRNDLLNIICAICALINYVFIMTVNASRDPLTHLYDRRTYYEDIAKHSNQINGIIQIDMNGLKYLNDNLGHAAGDEALLTVSEIFHSAIDLKTMCLYRLSGDEFLILMFDGKKEKLDETVKTIKEEMDKSAYSVAIGSYFFDKKKDSITFLEAMKTAEEKMYEDKNAFYKESGKERRKVNK